MRACVCIPTRNRADLLRLTLESLNRQSVDRDRLQVVVGDDGSTDATLSMLQAFAAGFELRWTGSCGRGSGAARNAAARAAAHEVLIFLDDDQIASPDLVAAHLEAHERFGVVMVQGDYPLAWDCHRGGASLVYEQARVNWMTSTHGTDYRHLWGANFSVRRQTWAEVGGFDEDLPRNQDQDFGLRVTDLGVPFISSPQALSHHLHRVSIAGLRRQSFEMGCCMVRISRKRRVPVAVLLASPIDRPLDRPLDRLVRRFWRWSPRCSAALGWAVGGLLWAADRLRLRPAQVVSARLLRRFHFLGGIAVESLYPGSTPKDADSVPSNVA